MALAMLVSEADLPIRLNAKDPLSKGVFPS